MLKLQQKNYLKILIISTIIFYAAVDCSSQILPGGVPPVESDRMIEKAPGNLLSLILKLPVYKDKVAGELSIRGAVLFKYLGIGFDIGSMLTNSKKVMTSPQVYSTLSLDYTGLEIFYRIINTKTFNLNFGFMPALGRLGTGPGNFLGIGVTADQKWYFFNETFLHADYRISRNTSILAGFSYRYTFPIVFHDIINTDLNGPIINIGITFYGS